MNYQEFLYMIKSHVAQQFGSDYTVSLQTVEKNNGVKYEGLTIMKPGYNISPLIYLPPYYHRYLEGVSLSEICDDICLIYKQNLPSSTMDISFFFDYERVRPHIIPKLINYTRNSTFLEKVPHIRFLDLAIVFQCLLKSPSEEYATILIQSSHAEYWKVSADALYQASLCNGPLLLPGRLNDLKDILSSISPDSSQAQEHDLFSHTFEDTLAMYVLSNPRRINGAAVMLYEGLLSRIANRFGRNLVVLPSSIHEVLLIPVSQNIPEKLSFFRDMVHEVNETQVSDDEVLSDQAYLFLQKEQQLQLLP